MWLAQSGRGRGEEGVLREHGGPVATLKPLLGFHPEVAVTGGFQNRSDAYLDCFCLFVNRPTLAAVWKRGWQPGFLQPREETPVIGTQGVTVASYDGAASWMCS